MMIKDMANREAMSALVGNEFDFGDRVWLNCAHQGPLPGSAVIAAQRALQ
jgi:hypothetical protein